MSKKERESVAFFNADSMLVGGYKDKPSWIALKGQLPKVSGGSAEARSFLSFNSVRESRGRFASMIPDSLMGQLKELTGIDDTADLDEPVGIIAHRYKKGRFYKHDLIAVVEAHDDDALGIVSIKPKRLRALKDKYQQVAPVVARKSREEQDADDDSRIDSLLDDIADNS